MSADDAHVANARWHAIRRAWQRFGVALGMPDIVALEEQIWHGRARWVADLGGLRPGLHLRQAYRVRLRGVERLAVFDVRLGCIVTFLRHERDLVLPAGEAA